MKFDSIKVGDIVFTLKSIRYGFHKEKHFWMPASVNKITPKQFEVNGVKYNKKDGSMVGGSYGDSCYKQGDQFHGTAIKDESMDYEAFKEKVAKVISIKNLLFKLEGSKATTPLIEADLTTLQKLSDILEILTEDLK